MGRNRFITSPEQLDRFASGGWRNTAGQVPAVRRFPIKIPAAYLENSLPGSPRWEMAVPDEAELPCPGEADDDGEKEITVMPGLLHAYPCTVLLLVTNRCFLHCRYCFRNRMVGGAGGEVLKDIPAAVAYVREHPGVDTVVFSGGDPFCLPTAKISRLLDAFGRVDRARFIRLGTRSPACFPRRILDDPSLAQTIADHCRPDRRIHVVCQINHPDEMGPDTIEAAARLTEAGACLYNQAVLLRGINDRPEVLAELMNRCAAAGISPYYLYQCRPRGGAPSLFQVPLAEGAGLAERARSLCGGLGNRFRYVLSHRTGKIEILGRDGRRLFFRYLQARSEEDGGKTFSKTLRADAGWLD